MMVLGYDFTHHSSSFEINCGREASHHCIFICICDVDIMYYTNCLREEGSILFSSAGVEIKMQRNDDVCG